MKIKHAHIDGFGKWHDQDFDFMANPQLIYGPNEAGKTTLMKFLISVLFGFADGRGKNRFAQYIPKDTASYGGSVIIEVQGQDYRIQRRKGKNGGKVTVTGPNGQQGGEAELQKLLGTMDRSLYQALFSFGQRDLAAVDEVDRSHWQQHLQQLGAVGSDHWAPLLDQYQKHADHLYKPRGRKWPLNQDLQQYAALTEKINQAREKYQRYQKLRTQLRTAQTQLADTKQKLAKQEPRSKELAHLQQVWPVYEQWRKNQPSDQSPIYLSDEQITTAQKLQVREKELHRQQANFQQRIAAINQEHPPVSRLDPREFLTIQQLKKELVTLQAAVKFQQRQQDQEKQWQAELTTLRARYDHPLPAPLNATDRTALAQLVQQSSRVQRQATGAEPPKQLMLGIVAGFILFIIGLLTNAAFITALGAVVTFAIIMYLYIHHGHNQSTASALSATDSRALLAFGRQHGLQDFSPDQWLLMQGDLQRNAELCAQLAQANQEQQKLASQLAAFKRQLPAQIHGGTLTEISASLDQLIALYQQANQDQQADTREKATIASNLSQLNRELADVRQQKLAIYHQADLHDDSEFANYLTERTAAQSRAAATDAYGKQVTPAARTALAKYQTAAELVHDLTAVRNQISQLNLQRSDLQATIQKTKLEIASLVEDGTLSNLEQKRANLAARIWDETQEWLTYQLAIEWVKRALNAASSDRYPALIRQAEHYFAILTGDHYCNIKLTDNGLTVVRRDQQVFFVEELSQGTAEQLYIALRLGFVAVMSDQANFPVIIDDGFVNFDNVRRQRMLELLNEIAKNNQVLYFTADDRVKELASDVLDLQALNHE
ncbi:ATP-binding protein [Limosilactobacillus walteri]|uniref:DNA repair protein n=1 Tax=Limosilactobacillus walteri TaxID=2268022 RepID=A0ABR8P9M0_9LACO|nr:AAA family ATPase [Limosilactobacillus walteri]MBD5807373.1 DNA repair protein [Limosilactobacillus walteri]